MQVRLLYPDTDRRISRPYSFPQDLKKDLNLDVVVRTMSHMDDEVYNIIWTEMMHPLTDERTIRYRQEIIDDISRHQKSFVKLHTFLKSAERVVLDFRKMESDRRGGGRVGGASLQIEKLRCLNDLTENYEKLLPILEDGKYESEGMRGLTERLFEEMPKERLKEIKDCLHQMQFWLQDGSIVLSAGFTSGMKLGDFRVNRVANDSKSHKVRQKLSLREQLSKTILKTNVIMLQTEAQIGQEKSLEEAAVAWILSGFDEYFENSMDFFAEFYRQACFFLGCMNLVKRFKEWDFPLCAPEVSKEKETSFNGLYDISLAIYNRRRPIANELEADADLFVISGANQGGKSTYLRSIGCAQILLQCGMLVPAVSYKSRLYTDLFTHFGRKEDKGLNSGRLDEELRRMDRIMEKMCPGALLLLNESFSSTTEPEGTMILRNITDALYELNVTVFSVTHLYEYSSTLYQLTQEELSSNEHPRRIFLSAQRQKDSQRTYRIRPDVPEPTSYGLDLYREIMGE